jgi:hypothetical protein
MYSAAGLLPQAVVCSVKSLCRYPLPYVAGDAAVAAERPRRLLVNLLRWLHLKATTTAKPAVAPVGAPGLVEAGHE